MCSARARADLIHSLSGRISVVMMNIPFCQEALGRLQRYVALDPYAQQEVAEVLRALDDVASSCVGTADLLDRLREA